MKDSLVCHCLCSDPLCEDEHANTCVICGSKTCCKLDPICSCDEDDAPEDPDDTLGIRARRALFSELFCDEPDTQEPDRKDRQPSRFMFRFTCKLGAKA